MDGADVDPTRIAAVAAAGAVSIATFHAAGNVVDGARERGAQVAVETIVRDVAADALLSDGRPSLGPADGSSLQQAGAHAAIVAPDGSALVVVDIAGELWEASVLPGPGISPSVHSVRPAAR